MKTRTMVFILLLMVSLTVVPMLVTGCTKSNPGTASYHCPMHPQIVSDKPGKCPICGMDLVPFVPADMPDKGVAAATAAVPEGLSAVSLTQEGLRLAGVQTVKAVTEDFEYDVRTVGTVVADETQIRHVHTKISGWIEKLYINFTGQMVRKGEPILSLYSPELVASQEEYLRSLDAAKKLGGSSLPEVKSGAGEIAVSARKRLELFDMPENAIRSIEASGKTVRAVTFPAPVTGFVTTKQTYEGQRVEPENELFTVTDLSRIWIETDFYEYEAGFLSKNMKARFTAPFLPGRELSGRVAYIYPYVNTQTRTLKVRFDFDNRDLSLKPGMYVNVRLDLDAGRSVVIPDSAVMDTGERQVVYIDAGGGMFEPKLVKIGIRHGGKAQVLSGIASGDMVVTRGNFLVDSESRIRAALSAPAENSVGSADGGSK